MSRPKGSKNRTKEEIASVACQEVKPIAEYTPEVEIVLGAKYGSERAIVEGWINIQGYPTRKRLNYCTGGDIHESIEQAKKAASTYTLGQVYIKLERKRE
jgi:hypothetical protein